MPENKDFNIMDEIKKKEEQAIKDRKIKEDRERREYERKLRQEQLEIMKLKSGVIQESEVIKEEKTEVIELTKNEKIKNFFYYNKIFIIFGIVFSFIIGYIIYDSVTRNTYDISVLVYVKTPGAYDRMEEIEAYLEKYGEDVDGNGKVQVEVFYVEANIEYADSTTIQASATKLAGVLQSEKPMLVLTDQAGFEKIGGGSIKDITPLFPENKLVSRQGVNMIETGMSDEISWTKMPEDLYLTVREVPAAFSKSTREKAEKHQKNALDLIENLLEEYN